MVYRLQLSKMFFVLFESIKMVISNKNLLYIIITLYKEGRKPNKEKTIDFMYICILVYIHYLM